MYTWESIIREMSLVVILHPIQLRMITGVCVYDLKCGSFLTFHHPSLVLYDDSPRFVSQRLIYSFDPTDPIDWFVCDACLCSFESVFDCVYWADVRFVVVLHDDAGLRDWLFDLLVWQDAASINVELISYGHVFSHHSYIVNARLNKVKSFGFKL